MPVYHGIILTDVLVYHKVKPLGAYRIADQLRKQGYEILVIDWISRISQQQLQALLDLFVSEHTLFLGWSNSLFFPDWTPPGQKKIELTYIHAINDYARSLNPNLVVMVGGASSNRVSEQANLQQCNFGVDYVIHGFADQVIVDLIYNIKHHLPLPVNVNRPSFIPVIDYDIKGETFDFHNSVHHWHDHDMVSPGECLPLEIARGCVFRCKFCAYPLLGKDAKDDAYIRKENNVLAEIMSNHERFGTKTYFVVDDTFNERTDKIRLLLNVRDRSKLDLNFVGYNRLDLIARRPEQLPMLRDLNFNGFFFGIESMNHASAKAIGKGLSPQEIKDTLHRVRSEFQDKVGILAGFILGLPHENEDTLQEWMPWLESHDCPIDAVSLSVLAFAETGHTKSIFAQDPSRYGYRFDHAGWANDHWNQARCNELQKLHEDRMFQSGRQKISCFRAVGLLKFGFTYSELIRTPAKDGPYQDLDSVTDRFVDTYVTRLFGLASA